MVSFLYQFGGPSHIDMFDMKPGAPEGIRRLLYKLPRGPLTVHIASVLSSGGGGFYKLWSAGCTRGWMNLLVAIMQRTTILNFSGHALHTGRG